jgi:hypothetical protein
MIFLGQTAVATYKMNGGLTPGITEGDQLIDE